MVYKNDFVAVVKCDGKILREDKDTVFVPFGKDYSILMKNLYGRKAVVSVFIDGQDVLKGSKLLIDANRELELERFLDNLDEGNKFRFIKKTEKVQEHRGDKIDDGIIRIEFQFEKQPVYNVYNGWDNHTTLFNKTSNPRGSSTSGSYHVNDSTFTTSNINLSSSINTNVMRGKGLSNSDSTFRASASMATMDGFDNIGAPKAEEGITVKGSKSNQQFRVGTIGELENEKHVITLMLKGVKQSGNLVEEPLTTKTKKQCSTCNKVNKSNSKYCAECGTFLD
jgi:hypothetical protein